MEEKLKEAELRVELDNRNETMQAKIRDAQLQKIPYMLVIGKKEGKARTVSVRLRDGKDLGAKKLDEFTERVRTKIVKKDLLLW